MNSSTEASKPRRSKYKRFLCFLRCSLSSLFTSNTFTFNPTHFHPTKMQFKFQLSALFIALAVGLVSAAPVVEDVVAARSVSGDCFNLGFEDGESSGCNAASGNNRARDVSARQLQCTGSLADPFNQGFNAGFNDGFTRCS
ncbi:hypothetical protein C8R45DRAFT_1013260 [Mycena sanguinolenta]|nr:hypothetical protein C8R45DRAFT_1013260 [Mycena sanguinolenta]